MSDDLVKKQMNSAADSGTSRLAVASQSAAKYSETFIRMQMERLPCVMRIHGGPVASETIPGGAIGWKRNLQGMLEAGYYYGLRKTGLQGLQEAELGRRLRRARVQVVLANFGHKGCELLPVCQGLGIPLVVHFHGYDAHSERTVNQYRQRYARLGQEAAAVIAVSRRMVDALQDLGIPKERIRLVRYGVDETQFRAKTEFPATPVFFGVGRFVDKKAPYLTLLAFREVHRRHPDARLILGGDGVLLEATRNLAVALGLGGAVEFPGVLRHEEVSAWMQRATAFVQHSITPATGPLKGDCEGTPVSILESMVCGLPVISTRHTGIGEVVTDGSTGLLVDERDVEGMAGAMKALAASTELARRLGAAARREALERYTAKQYMASLRGVLDSVL